MGFFDDFQNWFSHSKTYDPVLLAQSATALEQFASTGVLPTVAEAQGIASLIGPVAVIVMDMDALAVASLKSGKLSAVDLPVQLALNQLHTVATDSRTIKTAATGVAAEPAVPQALAFLQVVTFVMSSTKVVTPTTALQYQTTQKV